MDVNIWALGVTGLISGLLGSVLGVGGGFITVPVLTLVFDIPIETAIACSLVAIVATSSTAASMYSKSGLANIRLGLFLATASTPGAIAGGFLVAYLSSSILAGLFSVLLLYVSYNMLTGKTSSESDATPSDHVTDLSSTGISARFNDSYYDHNLNKQVNYVVKRLPLGWGGGFVAGILASLLGIGGGIVQVPVMNLLMRIPMKATIATSTYMIAITAATGALIHLHHGNIVLAIVAPLVIGVFIGAMAGSEIAQKTRGKLLRRIFGIFIIVTAILMMIRAIGLI